MSPQSTCSIDKWHAICAIILITINDISITIYPDNTPMLWHCCDNVDVNVVSTSTPNIAQHSFVDIFECTSTLCVCTYNVEGWHWDNVQTIMYECSLNIGTGHCGPTLRQHSGNVGHQHSHIPECCVNIVISCCFQCCANVRATS